MNALIEFVLTVVLIWFLVNLFTTFSLSKTAERMGKQARSVVESAQKGWNAVSDKNK